MYWSEPDPSESTDNWEGLIQSSLTPRPTGLHSPLRKLVLMLYHPEKTNRVVCKEGCRILPGNNNTPADFYFIFLSRNSRLGVTKQSHQWPNSQN